MSERDKASMMRLLRSNNLKAVLPLILLLACAISLRTVGAQAQTAQSPLPPPTGYVNDYANVIDAETKNRLETTLDNLKKRADIEFAIVTVKTTGNTDIDHYSLAVARGWGIGSPEGEKNGLLLLVAIDDHKYVTQVSRHLEGDLPDSLTGQIQREKLVPKFKQQQYSQGIYDTVQTYAATLAEARGFTVEGIDQRQAYREPETSDRGGSSGRTLRGFSPCAIIFVIIIVLLLFSGMSRGRGGGGGGGCLNALLLGSLFNSLGRGGGGWGGGSGWSGGGFGGSGGGGGGFGGFGGGGDFGGGGSGGSW